MHQPSVRHYCFITVVSAIFLHPVGLRGMSMMVQSVQ